MAGVTARKPNALLRLQRFKMGKPLFFKPFKLRELLIMDTQKLLIIFALTIAVHGKIAKHGRGRTITSGKLRIM